MTDIIPTLLPLGDRTILLRFAQRLDDPANDAAIRCAARLLTDDIPGVTEIVPNLVSVSIHYDPFVVNFDELAGQLRLKLSATEDFSGSPSHHTISVRFGDEYGPDLAEVAKSLNMNEAAFIVAHNASAIRVLATGFAPGFVYCGMHPKNLELPRRSTVRQSVPPGTILFAAGQTAITATSIPTGWHVIGRTDFSNFDLDQTPPTKLVAGDIIQFEVAQ